jgi:hypothetical protein
MGKNGVRRCVPKSVQFELTAKPFKLQISGRHTRIAVRKAD